MQTLAKQATLGGEPEAKFEQSLATLFFNYVRDKAPALLPHVVGFQLLDRNQDNTSAAGVYGFLLGDQWLYAPAFFINGAIKGHELLYLANKDLFVPLKENWVNYLIGRHRPDAGGPAGRNFSSRLLSNPDLSLLRDGPSTMKMSHVLPPRWKAGFSDMASKYAAMYCAASHPDFDRAAFALLAKHADLDTARVLEDFLSRDVATCHQALDLLDRFPVVKAALSKFHGEDFLSRCVDRIATKTAAAEKSAAADRVWHEVSHEMHAFASELLAAPAFSIKTAAEHSQLLELSEAEQASLARKGYLVQDNRPREKCAAVFTAEFKQQLTNPTCTGVYQTLVSPGELKKCLVIYHPHKADAADQPANQVLVISLGDSKHFVTARAQDVWVQEDATAMDEYSKLFKGLSSKATPSDAGTYVALLPDGSATLPFRVRQAVQSGAAYMVSTPYFAEITRDTRSLPSLNPENGCCSGDAVTLRIKDKVRTQIYCSGDVCFIPDNAKFVSVTDADDSQLHLAGWAETLKHLHSKTASLKIYAAGSEYLVNQERCPTKLAALKTLMGVHHVTGADAEQLLREADRLGVQKEALRVRIYHPQAITKAPFIGNPAATFAPAMQEPPIASQSILADMPTQLPFAQEQRMMGMGSEMTASDTYSNDPSTLPQYGIGPGSPVQQAMQEAAQAAGKGEKEVFDTALLSGLLRNVRQESLTEEYLPDLQKGLDRLGRLLFLFHRHGPAFEDRYGRTDMPELEDSLRNSFETLGDLVLFLKEKDVEPLAGFDSTPNIDDSGE